MTPIPTAKEQCARGGSAGTSARPIAPPAANKAARQNTGHLILPLLSTQGGLFSQVSVIRYSGHVHTQEAILK